MNFLKKIFFVLAPCAVFAAQYAPLPVDSSGKLAPSSNFVGANGIVVQNDIKTRKFRQKFRLFIETVPSPESNSMTQSQISRSNPNYYIDSQNTLRRTKDGVGNELKTFPDYYRYYYLRWWTDTEIKVIDKFGNLIVFITTIAPANKQIEGLHPNIYDRSARIFGWSALYQNDSGGCWGAKIELVDRSSSLGEMVGHGGAISAIWIYPSIDSAETRSVPVYTGAGVYTMQTVVWGKYLRAAFENPENTVLAWRQDLSDGEYFNGAKLWRPVRIEYYGDFEEITE